jgi:hypothetical protein
MIYFAKPETPVPGDSRAQNQLFVGNGLNAFFLQENSDPAHDPSLSGVDREQDIASMIAIQATFAAAASERDSKYITMYIIPNKIA